MLESQALIIIIISIIQGKTKSPTRTHICFPELTLFTPRRKYEIPFPILQLGLPGSVVAVLFVH
jgi:hypothetical protein